MSRYAIIKNGEVAFYEELSDEEYAKLETKNPVKAGRRLPVAYEKDAIDPATQRPGEPVVTIAADAVTIHTPAVALTAGEKAERTAERKRARRAAILAVAAERAAILQAIADGKVPANTPLPEYPA
jgi:hypothetical protein